MGNTKGFARVGISRKYPKSSEKTAELLSVYLRSMHVTPPFSSMGTASRTTMMPNIAAVSIIN